MHSHGLLSFSCKLALVASVAAMVPDVTLNNGVKMPVIALGTAGYDNSTVADAVEKAFAAGITHIHSAYDYFNTQGVANGLKTAKSRGAFFLTSMTTPCQHPAAPPIRNVTDPDACYNLTIAEFQENLDNLGVDYVDLMLLHGPSEPFGNEGGCSKLACDLNTAQWRAYSDMLKAGKAKAIGVSNYCPSCFECLKGGVVPAVNQIQLHVGSGADPEGLLSYCKSKGIVVQAYAPLAAGAVASDSLCTKVGKAHSKSAAQVGLKWILQNTLKPTLVVKVSRLAFAHKPAFSPPLVAISHLFSLFHVSCALNPPCRRTKLHTSRRIWTSSIGN
jgi:2,5-diketo-D-gluconate reductase A